MNTKLLKILLAGAVVAFGSSTQVMANSTPLLSGTTVQPLVLATNGPSTLVASDMVTFSALTIAGNVQVAVRKNFADNPWSGAGGLTFIYEVTNTTGPDSVSGFSVDGWTNFLTNVSDFSMGAGSIQPYSATRSNTGTLTFGFLNPPTGFGLVAMGQNSWDLIIYTNATSWTTVTVGVRDGSGVTLSTLGPAVPDGGTTALLLGLGLLGMGLIRRSKKS
jgi:hypothetical protein